MNFLWKLPTTVSLPSCQTHLRYNRPSWQDQPPHPIASEAIVWEEVASKVSTKSLVFSAFSSWMRWPTPGLCHAPTGASLCLGVASKLMFCVYPMPATPMGARLYDGPRLRRIHRPVKKHKSANHFKSIFYCILVFRICILLKIFMWILCINFINKQ